MFGFTGLDLKRFEHWVTNFQATGGVPFGWRPNLPNERRPAVAIVVLIFTISEEMAGSCAMELANVPRFCHSLLHSQAVLGRVNKEMIRKESVDLAERDEDTNWNMCAHSPMRTETTSEMNCNGHRRRDSIQQQLLARREENLLLLRENGTSYHSDGETVIAAIQDDQIERASLTYWRYRLHVEPQVRVPDILLSNGFTLLEALSHRFPDVDGERERRMITLRQLNLAACWPDEVRTFNWLRIGVMAQAYDLSHLLRPDVIPLLRTIHEFTSAHAIKTIFRDIKIAADYKDAGAVALQTSRAQPLPNAQFWDLYAACTPSI